MVSIAGGEPLVHPEMHVIARELSRGRSSSSSARTRILMKKKLELFKPSPYFAWVVHLDGMRERHDEFVERDGIFDKAVDGDPGGQAPRLPGEHEYDLLDDRHPEDRPRRARLPERRAEGRPDDALARLRLREGARPGALPRRRADPQALPRGVRRRAAEGLAPQPHARSSSTSSKARSTSSARRGASRATPSFGWQRPCYLMADGYTKTYKELIETTDWSKYGRGQRRAATTAWRTAATSRRRCWLRRSPSGSRCGR